LLGGGPGDIPIVHTLYDIYAEWNEIVEKFPKVQRYALGERVSLHTLTVLELVLTASANTKDQEKLTALQQASAKLDLIKLLVRLSKDCKCIGNNQYLHIESRLIETGKMLGGWIKRTQEDFRKTEEDKEAR